MLSPNDPNLDTESKPPSHIIQVQDAFQLARTVPYIQLLDTSMTYDTSMANRHIILKAKVCLVYFFFTFIPEGDGKHNLSTLAKSTQLSVITIIARLRVYSNYKTVNGREGHIPAFF